MWYKLEIWLSRSCQDKANIQPTYCQFNECTYKIKKYEPEKYNNSINIDASHRMIRKYCPLSSMCIIPITIK